jgi:hypothetical protein
MVIEMLGVDLWGTIRHLYTGEMIPDAFTALWQLVNKRFGERVWLVSAAREEDAEGCLRWLKKQNFYEKTGIRPDHVRFCRLPEKPGLYEKLCVTHIIDDNEMVMRRTNGVQNRYRFHADGSLPLLSYENELTEIKIVTNWKEVLDILIPRNEAG